jgi:beta-glucanase (GH16 family)
MKLHFARALVAVFSLVLVATSCTDEDPEVVSLPASAYAIKDSAWQFETTPAFSDEFDGSGRPDPTKWTYDVGGSGWGNNELQYYTAGDNCDIANGKLTITARKEDRENSKYTSSRMVTRGLADFTYGRFEARMKLPVGRGTWPAFWMLPTDRAYGEWPRSGEIDIMEHVGYDPNVVHISTHCEAFYFKLGNQKSSKLRVPTAQSDFHNYRVDWTPYSVRGYIDSVNIFEYTNPSQGSSKWPFDKRFHMLLNIAIGGDWGGASKINNDNGVDNSIFPAKLEVDYVRVYKIKR